MADGLKAVTVEVKCCMIVGVAVSGGKGATIVL